MHAYSALSLMLAAAGLASAALPKANEYKSDDCSGALNYGHHSFDLHTVTMDDTSNSVYQDGTRWYVFDGKTSNGGTCKGKFLGQLKASTLGSCLNLNTVSPGYRVRCLCNPLAGATKGINSCQYMGTS
ncbi:small secreted protein [Lasiosphaeria hispida]|uniref:Small secreted protein n=1 Tax=Lasiosphaeria hispida TaxID=260671 RepID=A0AAJ0HEZ7_9PEZI|nr:small secreted protein [Lasiosphaeria hispida]